MDKKNIINIIASLVAILLNFAINFFLSPFIIRTLGVEAYGFINLANTFTSYVSIITIALNSMANRFISVSVFQKKMQDANKYYNSVFLTNILISCVLFVPLIIFSFFIEKVINVPVHLVGDVKILFSLVFINFLISCCTSTFGIGYFVRNKLYLSSIKNVLNAVLKAIVIVVLFVSLVAKVYYVAIASIAVAVITIIYDLCWRKKLVPEIKLSKGAYSATAVKVLLASGVWNLVGQLSGLLNTGLDLLISNLFISATAMGILATAKTIPIMIDQVMQTVASSFSPNITKYYSENNHKAISSQVKYSAITIGILLNVIVAGFIGFGDVFFKLWVPSEDSNLLYILSVLTLACVPISITTISVYSIFTAYNKLKVNALVNLGVAVLNIIIVVPLVILTDYGLYAIAGVSTILAILKNFLFIFPYAAKVVGVKWYTFYVQGIRNIISIVVITGMFILLKNLIDINSWGVFIGVCAGSGVVGYIVNTLLLYDKYVYKKLYAKIKTKLTKQRS